MIFVLLFQTYFSLYNRTYIHPPHNIDLNLFLLILSNFIVYTYLNFFIHSSRLLPCPDYCQYCCDEYWEMCVLLSYGFLRVYA